LYFVNNNNTGVGRVTVDSLNVHKDVGSLVDFTFAIKIYKGYLYAISGSKLKKSSTPVPTITLPLTVIDPATGYNNAMAFYNDNVYTIINGTIKVINTETFANTVINLSTNIGSSNASYILYPYMYFGSNDAGNVSSSSVRRYNLNTGVLDISWCIVGEITLSMTYDNAAYLYLGGTSTIKRVSIDNPSVVTTVYTINYKVYGLAIYNNFLYASYTNDLTNGSTTNVTKYDLNRPNEFIPRFTTNTGVQGIIPEIGYGIDLYGGYLYGTSPKYFASPNNLEYLQIAQYYAPKNISINSINVLDISSGNVQVSIIDIYNPLTDNIYYYYSLNGNTYTLTGTKADDSKGSSNSFNIAGLSRGTYTIYVKAVNSEGNSNIVSSTFGVYSNPVSFNSYTISNSTSGNVDVTIIDTNNEVINNVGYYYYAYNRSTTPNNWNDITKYTYSGQTKNYLGNTYSFTISGLTNNLYTVYLLRKILLEIVFQSMQMYLYSQHRYLPIPIHSRSMNSTV
jgi:hypothetical protein